MKLFLDLETTGVDLRLHSIIEIGAIAYDEKTGEAMASFRVQVRPLKEWSDYCVKMHKGKPFEKGNTNTEEVSLRGALMSLGQWVKETFEDKPSIIGFNAHFDYYFIDTAYKELGLKNPLSHRITDLNSIGALFGINSSLGAFERFGIKIDKKKLHTALYDCELGIKVYERYMARSPSNLHKMITESEDPFQAVKEFLKYV